MKASSEGGREVHAEECSPGARALEEILSLAEAAMLSGLSAHTLAQQAEKGKLRARKVGRTWVTTRDCLEEYLRGHARNGRPHPGADASENGRS